jgi:hypothetical protein
MHHALNLLALGLNIEKKAVDITLCILYYTVSQQPPGRHCGSKWGHKKFSAVRGCILMSLYICLLIYIFMYCIYLLIYLHLLKYTNSEHTYYYLNAATADYRKQVFKF